jgi:GNAT superfamily N-acetyltransferase
MNSPRERYSPTSPAGRGAWYYAVTALRSERFVEIRKANATDSDEILSCLAAAFAQYRDSYTPGAFVDTVLNSERLQHRMREMCVFVAVSEGRVVGTLACSIKEDEGHLRGMAVLPGWQGRGVASALLHAAESELRDRRVNRVTLDTTEPLERAGRFYERHGFARSGLVSDFFGMRLHEHVKILM